MSVQIYASTHIFEIKVMLKELPNFNKAIYLIDYRNNPFSISMCDPLNDDDCVMYVVVNKLCDY